MSQEILSSSLPIGLSSKLEALTFTAVSLLSFVVPFSLGHPQWLVGTIVNACLFLSAIFLPKKFLPPLIILPSLGVLVRGLVFGPLTVFLIYFLPFIWLSNLVLILVFKRFYNLKYFPSVFFAATIKFLLLLTAANIYFGLHLVPKLFLQTMGIGQFLTALAGGMVSWSLFKIYEQYNPRNTRTV